MEKRWKLAVPLLISSCAMVNTTSLGSTLILKPQIQDGNYSTKTVVNPYTQASINHLILKLYTFDDTEHDQGIQKSIPNADLGKSITFSNLKANTTYRIKAYAYFTADESQPISTNDANSYTDITLTNDDHPTIAALKVKLINIAFNGQGTGSLQITNGGYTLAKPEGLQFINQAIISTFAGGGGATNSGCVDGVGTAARFTQPWGIAVDGAGNLYVSDLNNHQIRKITSTGTVTTLAGQAHTSGYANGTGTTAMFSYPRGIAVDSSGNVFVGDYFNHVIRKITSTGVVSTFVGGGGGTIAGYADGSGTAAMFDHPKGVALDSEGNLYVADMVNQLIRKVTSTGVVTTFAGRPHTSGFVDGAGTNAMFDTPKGVATDGDGNVYVADTNNHLVRKITSTGVVSTIAGQPRTSGYANGTGTSAAFNYPSGLALDGAGDIYVSDRSNNLIRKITSGGVVSTFLGGGGGTTEGSTDGTGTAAKINGVYSLVVDKAGNIFVADFYNFVIRLIK